MSVLSTLIAVIGLIVMIALVCHAAGTISVQWRDEVSAWRQAYFASRAIESGEKDKNEITVLPDKLVALIQQYGDEWAQASIEERARELFKLHSGNWETVTAQIIQEIGK